MLSCQIIYYTLEDKDIEKQQKLLELREEKIKYFNI